ncbi:MAG TPA: phosphate ABC transporter permease PtsA [Lentisphaeria bacterium]|nr:phosphate ABC transporter permease PtsA [Lentisphaeria bacterium]
MKKRPVFLRKMTDKMVKVVSIMAAFVGIFLLFWILFEVFMRGFSAFSPKFFMDISLDGENGGIANAIVGTVVITFTAVILGVPAGLLGGIFLSEYGRSSKIGNIIRFSSNVMMGMPSIIIGLFIYSIIVYNMGTFSGFSGAVALAIIMLPVVLRTTEDMLSLVPNSLREAALALGTPRWKVTLNILFRAAKTGLITGVLLATARVSGETAPLLFTALNSYYWPAEPCWQFWQFFSSPTANLTVTINDYAMSPYPGLNSIAWGASLLITFGVLALNISARIFFREEKK